MINGSPAVSIALPVYNGENFLREAIRSILRQTFDDFELLLLDNASTDGTSAICQESVEHDPRVRYVRSEVNRGLIWNHNRGVELARGKYFMWIEHDDLIADDYVNRCVKVLNDDPKVVLCFTNTQIIDENGQLGKRVSNHFDNSSPSSRIRSLTRGHIVGDAEFGLMRLEALKKTTLHRYINPSELVLLCELATRGPFELIPEHLFLRRHHVGEISHRSRSTRDVMLIHAPGRAGTFFIPSLVNARGFFDAIRGCRLPFEERVKCYNHLMVWLWDQRRDLYYECEGPLVSSLKRCLSQASIDRLKMLRGRLFGSRRAAASQASRSLPESYDTSQG
jgi:glycosyltransferase involved in cell wall biosynthesis